MTKEEYDNLQGFPLSFITHVNYKVNQDTILFKGETFTGVEKKTLGIDDYSIIDKEGHPHYYNTCDLHFKS